MVLVYKVELVLKAEWLAICLSMVDAKGMLRFGHLASKPFYDRPFIRLLAISPRRKGPGEPLPTVVGSA